MVGYLAGLCLLVALPHLAKQTYFSENALLPGTNLSIVLSCDLHGAVVDLRFEHSLFVLLLKNYD